jgi:hypothetical protein
MVSSGSWLTSLIMGRLVVSETNMLRKYREKA